MADPVNHITCQEIDKMFTMPPGSLEEWIRKMQMAEAHILGCPVCRAKYDTLATVADDVLNKKAP